MRSGNIKGAYRMLPNWSVSAPMVAMHKSVVSKFGGMHMHKKF
jgi:hypothetical protein